MLRIRRRDMIDIGSRLSLLKIKDIEEIRNKDEPNAWARKYLMALSVSFFMKFEVKMGINERRLSSSIIHINRILGEERARRVDRRRVDENNKVLGGMSDIR